MVLQAAENHCGDVGDKPVSSSTLEMPLPNVGGPSLESSILPMSDNQSPQVTKQYLDVSNIQGITHPAPENDGTTSPSPTALNPQASPGGRDRVFPIRSAVSVDSSQTPHKFTARYSRDHNENFPSTDAHSAGASISSSTQFRRNSSARSETDAKSTKMTSSLRRSLELESAEQTQPKRRENTATSQSNNTYRQNDVINLFGGVASESSSYKTGSTMPKTDYLLSDRASMDQESLPGHVTARFRHTVTKEGHAVITGHNGQDLQHCEDEPIHTPGAVQSFGLLIALEELEDSQMLVRIVSENSHRMIGYHPQELFKLDSFTDILSEEQVDNLLDHIDFIRDEDSDPAVNGPEVFTISIRIPSSKKARKLWCAVHINPSNPELIICEFELDDDRLYPLAPSNEDIPINPENTLDSNPSNEEYTESTIASNKPLRVLRSARKKKAEAAAMEIFNVMSQVQEQLASAPNLDLFLKVLVGVVKELTGFHRVMIYQFDNSYNGRVVTELVDPRATADLYKGLNFPASDIPKQARELYKVNKVRLLYDRDLETARLVCRTVEDLEQPLDLSFSYLRAMSPIHLKYLANMAVRSSMSISINAFGELWGLIACHTYGPKGMRVSFPIRNMCRLVGDTASRNIERLSYASRLQARKLINTVPTQTNPSGFIIASSEDLLQLFDADFGLLSIRGETKLLGKVEQTQEALAMLEYLRLRKFTSVIMSQDVKIDFPDLKYSPGFELVAGLLLIPLSVGGNDFIVFFRKPQIREVKWAGNPYEKFIKKGTEGFLEPRKSFKMWRETVSGKSREWTEEQVETAAVLCLVYGKFIEVWRQKELVMHNSQLTKLLLANSAHEVRTPLNAIINYLEIALEGQLDEETREHISKSHSASKSLIYVINDLLDLTKTEEGQDLIKGEIFNLPATIREAAIAFRGDAERKGLDFQVIEHPGFPQDVYGDERQTRQAVSNLIGNALQHTSSGWIRVEMYLHDTAHGRATVEIVISDSGAGMSNIRLDELFRELEQVTDDADRLRLLGDDESDASQGKSSRALGLGLAMVARHVRNAGGQLRLKSEEGKGSRFVIQLSFDLSQEDEARSYASSLPSASKHSSTVSQSSLATPQIPAGERTLVDRTSSSKHDSVIRKRTSFEEAASLHSYNSASSNRTDRSGKSEVDKLIDAISGPLHMGEAEPEQNLQRSASRRSSNSKKSAGSLGKKNLGAVTAPTERPSQPVRSMSSGVSADSLRLPGTAPIGTEYVTDNKTLISAIKVPSSISKEIIPGNSNQDDTNQSISVGLFKAQRGDGNHDANSLQTLVAEDDPINSRIIRKRLEKSGHEVYHTMNGKDCASAFAESPALYDVVLMDMQMPIVDGLTSTKMIRSFENSRTESHLSPRAAANGRVPIFAVSASLVERERQNYIEAGFDGWILKPIDFKRLNTLLMGIVDESVRNSCLYTPGDWEAGGWFCSRQQETYNASIETPAKRPLMQGRRRRHSIQSDRSSQGHGSTGSESGSVTPTPSQHSGKSLKSVPILSLVGLQGKDSPVLTPPIEHPEDEESKILQ